MNILLVEPDRILGPIIKTVLQKQDHNVVWCKSAQSALDSLDDKLPDVIIIELQLGIHNGIEFLYELRSYREWQHISVIVHTRNSNVLDHRFSRPFSQLGVQALLYKPRTNLKQLARSVGQFVET